MGCLGLPLCFDRVMVALVLHNLENENEANKLLLLALERSALLDANLALITYARARC